MSLKDCIKKFGKRIERRDRDFLLQELAEGKTDEQALDSLARVIRQEMRDVARQVEEQGGTIMRDTDEGRYFAQSKESQQAEDNKWSKWKPGKTSTGKITGAPAWVNRTENPGSAVAALERKLQARIEEGLVGRYWYEDSAKAVMNIVGGDLQQAEQFIQLIAIYSPQANVQVNTQFAVKAWNQYKRNDPISVKTGEQDAKATAVLYGNQAFEGRKTNSFYQNLMYELVKQNPKARAVLNLDPATVEGLDKPATIDMWMFRAFEYDNEAAADDKGSGAYSFAENMTRRITAKLNLGLEEGAERWTPHQVQAAIWTAMKARYETDWVKVKTNRESLRKGHSFIDENGKLQRKADADSQRAHRKIWGKWARSVKPDEATANAEVTAASFETFIDQMTETVTWETMPSTALNLAINEADDPVKAQFHREALQIIVDQDGTDELASMLGVPLNYVRLGRGAYEGMVNENYLSHLVPEKEQGGFDRDTVAAYARAIQYIYRQDAVPWFRADPRALLSKKAQDEQLFRVINTKTGKTVPKSKVETLEEAQEIATAKGEGFEIRGGKYARATAFTFKEKLSPEKLDSVLKSLTEAFGTDAGFTVTGPNEISVINFRDDQTGVPFVSDGYFQQQLESIEDALQELGVIDATNFWSEGEYGHYQDWKADPEGSEILVQGSIAGRPDLQAWVRDRRARFDALLEDYAAENLKDRAIDQRQIEYLAQSAFHGTGETRPIARFDTDYIGGGQGVGQFKRGWGLYFSNVRQIADRYRQMIAEERGIDTGALYEVDLLPAEDEYLLWDVGVEQQSPLVQEALTTITGRPMEYYAGINFKGGDIYNMLSRQYQSDKRASLDLLGGGIKGVKYEDADTRTSGFGAYNYVIFDGEQVEMIDRLMQSGMFYSALERGAKQLQKKGSGQQLLAQLKKMPGVKAEELEWLGIEDYLAGKESITRDEIVAFIQAGGVRIEEVTYGLDPRAMIEDIRVEMAQATADASLALAQEDLLGFETVSEALSMIERSPDWEQQWEVADERNRETLRRWRAKQSDFQERRAKAKPTKYEGYTLPGGTDYREIVMTLPPSAPGAPEQILGGPPQRLSKPDAADRIGVYADDFGPDTQSVLYYPSGLYIEEQTDGRFYVIAGRDELIAPTRQEAEQWLVNEMAGELQGMPAMEEFRNSHFDEPNIIGHIRFKTRTVNGKNTLFIEEIQSDWHQAGRKRGYKEKPMAPAEREALWEDITAMDRDMEAIFREYVPDAPTPVEWIEGMDQDGNLALSTEVGESLAEVVQLDGGNWGGMLEGNLYVTGATMEEAQARMNTWLAERQNPDNYDVWNSIREQTGSVWATIPEEVQTTLVNMLEERDEAYQAWEGDGVRDAVPNGPFKKTWPLLMMKRMIRYAVDNGYDQVAWTTGEQQASRYGDPAGMRGFYDQMLPSMTKKYIKKMDADVALVPFAAAPPEPRDIRAPTEEEATWEEFAPTVGEGNQIAEWVDEALLLNISAEEAAAGINEIFGDDTITRQELATWIEEEGDYGGPGTTEYDRALDNIIGKIQDTIVERRQTAAAVIGEIEDPFGEAQPQPAPTGEPIELNVNEVREAVENYSRGDLAPEEFAEAIGVEGQEWIDFLDYTIDFNVDNNPDMADVWIDTATQEIMNKADELNAELAAPAPPAEMPDMTWTSFTTSGLQDEYNAWLSGNNLPRESADELQRGLLEDAQVEELELFIQRWEETQEREDALREIPRGMAEQIQAERGDDTLFHWDRVNVNPIVEEDLFSVRIPIETDIEGEWMAGTLHVLARVPGIPNRQEPGAIEDATTWEIEDMSVGDWQTAAEAPAPAGLPAPAARPRLPAPKPPQVMVHAFPVTEKMRETATAGQALFQDRAKNEERARYFPNLNDERVIQLTEASDLSSFLHESGHLFLDIQKVWARKYGLNENQTAMLKWLGLRRFEDLTVEHHEKWAETFEVYLREGKAPSLSLRRAFASFARWLKRIYTMLSDPRLTRAKLDPEITEIFDRMLATQEELDEAEANPEHQMMFRSQEQAGMTDTEWDEYQARAARVRETAEMTLDEKVLREYKRQKSAEWKREKAPLVEKHKEMLVDQPEYQLLADLVVVKDKDGNVTNDQRMDWHQLKDAVGEIPRGKFIGKAVGGGVDPAIYAEQYGYASVKEMYDSINKKPTLNQAADAAAESEMLAKYGDILNDGTLEQEVRESMLNEDQAAMVYMELKAVRKKQGWMGEIAGPRQKINRQYLRSEAETLIAGMTYKQIKPDKYYRQMVKAAQKAARGETVVQSKIQQLANHYMYKSAVKTKQRMEKDRTKIRAVQNRDYKPTDVPPDYITQMKQLALMYDMRRPPKERERYANALLDWYAAQIDPTQNPDAELANLELMDPTLVDALAYRLENNGSLEGYELKTFNEMTAEELRGVVEMLDHLRYVGGQIALKGKEEVAAAREAGAEAVLEKGGKNFWVNPNKPRPFDQPKLAWSSMMSALPSLGNMVRKLDGFKEDGWAYRNILLPINQAVATKWEQQEKLHDMLDQYMGDISRVGLSQRDAQTFKKEDGTEEAFSSEEIFMMAVYWGTDSSRAAVMQGHNLTEQDVTRLIERLTPEQLKLVNAVWAMNESQWPALRDAAKDMLGTAPPKLKPAPFVVNGIQMSGGHMQLMYTGVKQELQDEQVRGMNSSNVVPTRAGSTYARVGSGGKQVRLQVSNIIQAAEEKAHYIAFARTGRDLRALINDNSPLADAIIQKHGAKFYKNFLHSIEGITAARPAQETNDGLAWLSRMMRGNATMMHLAFSIRNVTQQWGAAPIAMKEVGTIKFIQASGLLASRPKETIDLIETKSKFMKNRGQVVNREAREYLRKMMATNRGRRMWEDLKARGFILQTWVDMTVAYPTWYAKYNTGMEKHGDEKRAILDADTAVAESVGSGSDLHLGRIMQSNQNEFVKTLTVFGSWFNAYYQRLYRSSRGGTNYLNPQFLADGVLLPIIVANLTQMLIGDWPDEDEEWWEYANKNTLLFLAGTLPLVRDIGSLSQGFTPTTPLGQLMASPVRIYNEAKSYSEGNQSGIKLLADAGRATSQLVRLPGSGNVWRMLDYIDSYLRGEEGDDFSIWQGLTEGADRDR